MLREYEAVVSQRESLARVRATQNRIKQAGGKMTMTPSTTAGMMLVTLMLPEPLTPQHFFPDLPFYPV